jgi:hypothetical protein
MRTLGYGRRSVEPLDREGVLPWQAIPRSTTSLARARQSRLCSSDASLILNLRSRVITPPCTSSIQRRDFPPAAYTNETFGLRSIAEFKMQRCEEIILKQFDALLME